MRGIGSKFCRKKSSEDSRAPIPPAQMPGREEGGEDNEEEQGQRAASQQTGPPAPGGRNVRVLFLILLGFGVQMVKAVKQGMSIHRTFEGDLFPTLRVESGNRCKRKEFCEWRFEERCFLKEKEKKQPGRGHKDF